MLVSLTKEGIIDGARIAAGTDMSFDEYCELIADSLISGQSPDEVKTMLKSYRIDRYFSGEEGAEGGILR